MDRLIVNRRAHLYVAVVVLSLGASALTLPGLAAGDTGGASLTGNGPGGATNATGTRNAPVRSGNVTVSASGSGVSIATRASAMLSHEMQFTGSVTQSAVGKIVEIERSGHQTGWKWQPTAHGTVAPDGSFTAAWHTNHIGQFRIRAVIENAPGLEPHASTASPTVTVIVYRVSLATQYGPGFYGQQTACGVTLHRRTIGVANRTLPCGTRVAVYYQGRTLVVPVIDRGPYANGADWDLTEATGSALGVPGTAKIGAVSLPGR